MLDRWRKKLKKHFKEVLRIKKSPHTIALGFAIGAFIAIFPTFGLAFFIGLLIMLIFKRISKIALFAGIFFWNPLLTFPLYAVSFKLGNLLFGDAPVIEFSFSLLASAPHHTLRFFIGAFIVAVFFSLVSYFIIFGIAWWYQHNKRNNN